MQPGQGRMHFPGLCFAQFALLSLFDYVAKYIVYFHLARLSNVTGGR